MQVKTRFIQLETKGYTHIINITEEVQKILHEEEFNEGNVTVSAVGSTAGISTVEYEPGLINDDISKMLNKVAPYGVSYEHNKTWGDDNGASHLRSTLIGTSQIFPFQNGNLILGTWQQIIFIDFDTRNRNRKIVVQMIGE